MSVEKFVIKKESSNFTIVSNKVINGLKGQAELLGFYVYLLSLPPEWTFYKTNLRETCNIGIKKLERFLSQLAQMRLIETAQIREKNGRFAHTDLHILNGDLFEIKDLDNCAPRVNIHPAENDSTDLRSYIKNINKINIEKETLKSYCASDDARDISKDFFFDEFWKMYPRKKDKARARTAWRRNGYDKISSIIFEDIKNRMLNDPQWLDEKFIPHPSTYLRNERWEDEISVKKIPIEKETDIQRAQRVFAEMRGEKTC